MDITFTKMQGLGNDFVVINGVDTVFSMTPAQIQKMANRRFGVGFDQLLVVEPAKVKGTDFLFRIFNADGTEVGQCGNGARCIAHFIRAQGLSAKTKLCLSTMTGTLELKIQPDNKVSVQMGVPKFLPEEIPFLAAPNNKIYSLVVGGETVELSVVNVGNPHAIIRVEKIDSHAVSSLGEALSTHEQFPEGVNVGFVQVIDPQNVRLRVYERGAAETLACGSGACAAMVIGRRNGWLNERVTVGQQGGSLVIDWQGPGTKVQMTGSANTVFSGEWTD